MLPCWADFLENIADGIPGQVKTIIFLIILYPMVIAGIGVRGAGNTINTIHSLHPEYTAAILATRLGTAFLLPLYFLPAVYFWKERPV